MNRAFTGAKRQEGFCSIRMFGAISIRVSPSPYKSFLRADYLFLYALELMNVDSVEDLTTKSVFSLPE